MGDRLQDLKDRDIDNLEHLLKSKKTHIFKDNKDAFVEIGNMVRLAVLKCGVDLAGIMGSTPDPSAAGEMAQEAMEQNGVRIESRKYDAEEDKWRSGIYVYKNNEIASFISGIRKGSFGYIIETTEDRI